MFISASEFMHLILFVGFSSLISGSELSLDETKNATPKDPINTYLDDMNKKLDFIEFCKGINLNVSVIPNSHIYAVEVSFAISDPNFKDCYEYYDITLERRRKMVAYAKVKYRYDAEGTVAYEFQNVSCGIYGMTIHPCFNTWQCAPFIIMYPEPINLTSNECIGLALSDELMQSEKSEINVFAITAVFFVLMVLCVIGMILCYFKSVKPKSKQNSIICQNKSNGETILTFGGEELVDYRTSNLQGIMHTKNIEICIPHHYDRKGVNRRKIEKIKDFFLKCRYYNTVKTIEDELSTILCDVNGWLDEMLKEDGKGRSIRKIILVASDEDDEAVDYELENLIFSEFIDKVDSNIKQRCKGYDHLFVVQLDNSVNYSEKLQKIVKRVRFSLTEELIDEHLINLCLNLCSGSMLNMSAVEKDLREMLTKHPIRI